jgi:hypothetical protein
MGVFGTRLLGGVARDPQLVEAWLRGKVGISDKDELRHAWLRTLLELGTNVSEQTTFADAISVSKKLAESKVTAGFRENVNILYGGTRVGPTRKGPVALSPSGYVSHPNSCTWIVVSQTVSS